MNISDLIYFFKNEKFYILGFLRKSIIFGKRQKGGTKMRKKGQAAMEFLMTYGWAILAAIIVIGVLAIYFRPSSLTQTQVTLNAPLYANTWAINESHVAIEVQNQAGEVINISSASVTMDTPSGVTCAHTLAADKTLSISGLQVITLDCGSIGAPGTSFSGAVSVSIKRGGALATPVSGSISGTVADVPITVVT
jgi:uncharacterized protein (UPF0333 family)